MARPKRLIFYEEDLPQKLLASNPWLPNYNKHSKELVDYMVEHKAGSTAYYSTICCLTELRHFLLKHGESYSFASAEYWLSNASVKQKGYDTTLLRLADLYRYGKVQPLNAFPKALPYRKELKEPWSGILTSFLNTQNFGKGYVEQIKNSTSKFLYWLQKQGIVSTEGITFEILEDYLRTDEHKSQNSASRYTYPVGDILLYMADKGMCLYSLGWYPFFRRHGCIFKLCNFTGQQINRLRPFQKEGSGIPTLKLAKSMQSFLIEFKTSGYSKSQCKVANYTLHNLLLFLDMHELEYNKIVADIWLEHQKSLVPATASWKGKRRILNLWDVYVKSNILAYRTIFIEKQSLYKSLPPWYQEIIEEYMTLKIREGWEKSTLDMILSSVTRFCSYLEKIDVNSLSQITPDILKCFNIVDPHKSAEGKNAYNSRIRKFLMYLERKGIVPYGLHNALPGKPAPKENLTLVLTDEEKADLKAYFNSCFSAMELRNRAVIMIGVKMGLRASDIVTIKLSDIDWAKQSLRVIQEKTDHEILLPIPTSVCNAIYLYITNGRPNDKTSSRNLFVKHRMPYDEIYRGCCAHALTKALPERKIPGSSFHVTRKTYATERLNNGVGKQYLADLLGHKDTQSLDHYLSLDEKRMRMCPLSLSETGLEMEGGRYEYD